MAPSPLRHPFLHRGRLLLALAILAFVSTGCGIFEADDDSDAEEYLVLFIGNSYLGWHDTPQIFLEMAEAAGKTIEVRNNVINGYSLEHLAEDFQTTMVIREAPWDFVVLQSAGLDVAYPDRTSAHGPSPQSIPSVLEELRDIILENHSESQVLWMLPWAYEDGVTWTDGSTDDYAEMQLKIRDNAVVWADSLDLMLGPVGMAFYEILKDDPPLHFLHGTDQSHPNLRGTYLSAATFFAALFQESAEGIGYFSTLEEEEARMLQEVASRTVLESLSLWNITP